MWNDDLLEEMIDSDYEDFDRAFIYRAGRGGGRTHLAWSWAIAKASSGKEVLLVVQDSRWSHHFIDDAIMRGVILDKNYTNPFSGNGELRILGGGIIQILETRRGSFNNDRRGLRAKYVCIHSDMVSFEDYVVLSDGMTQTVWVAEELTNPFFEAIGWSNTEETNLLLDIQRR